jgi:predicted Fe-S protein YdhL (DUF1289 family)
VICPRCRKSTQTHTCSWFNAQDICLDCSREEQEHPDYRYARERERAAVLAGNYNFAGVGWPGPDGRVQR